jgi:hypothetical protein
MSQSDTRSREPELSPIDTPSGGGISEDWWAMLIGLALLLLGLLGFIPKSVLW